MASARDAAGFLEAMRAETRHRTWFATIFGTTISVTYVGSTFTWYLPDIPVLNPVGAFVATLPIFLVVVTACRAALWALRLRRHRAAGVSPLLNASYRRLMRELDRTFRLGAVPVSFGNGREGRIVAMRIAGHDAVAIGRGALTAIRRDPGVTRYRVAHEFAHLAGGDPDRDDNRTAVHAAAALSLLVTFGWTMSNMFDLSGLRRSGALWPDLLRFLVGSSAFALTANTLLFGGVGIALLLEQRSASRLREFYADAVASTVAAPPPTAFAPAVATGRPPQHFAFALLDPHPTAKARAAALTRQIVAYRADMMLFLLQGFFSAFVVEWLMQLMFGSSNDGVLSAHDHRASIWHLVGIGPLPTYGLLIFGAGLAASTHILVLMRLGSMLRVSGDHRARASLMAWLPFSTLLGTALVLATSVSVLWDLDQSHWDLLRYVGAAWDRLALHGVTLVVLCLTTLTTVGLTPKRNSVLVAMGSLPMLATLAAAYGLYR